MRAESIVSFGIKHLIKREREGRGRERTEGTTLLCIACKNYAPQQNAPRPLTLLYNLSCFGRGRGRAVGRPAARSVCFVGRPALFFIPYPPGFAKREVDRTVGDLEIARAALLRYHFPHFVHSECTGHVRTAKDVPPPFPIWLGIEIINGLISKLNKICL